MNSTLFLILFKWCTSILLQKNLLACLHSASSTVETISMIFPYLVNFYLQIQNPINLISMSTTCLESFGADLSENKLYQYVSILLTGTSTLNTLSERLAYRCSRSSSRTVGDSYTLNTHATGFPPDPHHPYLPCHFCGELVCWCV